METFPKIGMKYEQVRTRMKKYDKEKASILKNSLFNQVRLHEGDSAVKELSKEFSETRPRSFSGAGNKQIGIGPGKKFGTGGGR